MMTLLIFILVLLYSVSVIFYMGNMIKRDQRYEVWAYRILFLGGFIHSFSFSANMILEEYFPLLTMFDVLFFYSLALILFTIIIHHVLQWKLLEMLTVFLGIITLIGAISIGESAPIISETLISRLVLIHIVFSVISYSAFSLSAIFSLLFLVHDFLLKKKVWNRLTQSLPSLESLERNAYFANLLGIPMLFIGLIIGSVWASFSMKWIFFFDLKVIISFIVLFMYGWSVLKRHKRAWMNKQLAIWNLLSFIMVVINFSLANIFGSFHRWL